MADRDSATEPPAPTGTDHGPWPRRRRARHEPALPLLLAVCTGIGLDTLLGPTGPAVVWLIVWWTLCLLLAITGGWRNETGRRGAGLCLWLAIACLMAGWSELTQHLVARDEIACLADRTGRPIHLRGQVFTDPELFRAPTTYPAYQLPELDRTAFLLAVDESLSLDRIERRTGRVRVNVEGHLPGIEAGDRIELFGILDLPSEPMNPGAFDYAAWLKSQGVLAVVRCDGPESITRLSRSGNPLQRVRTVIRRRCDQVLQSALSERAAALGLALLLGTRTSLDTDLRDAFAQSGTMHILAISGANVVILAGLLWLFTRAVRLSTQSTSLLIISLLWLYLWITDGQPPVLRAVWMLTLYWLGAAFYRPIQGYQVLCWAAVAVLIQNPADLFDLGAQLSFLAVMGLVWLNDPLGGAAALFVDRNAEHVLLRNRWHRWFERGIRRPSAVSLVVWCLTIPLALSRFHLLSLVGLILTTLLGPLTAVTMGTGYLTLIVAAVIPPLAGPIARLYGWELEWLIWCIESTASIPGSHCYLSGPPFWWVLGFYLLALSAMLRLDRLGQRWNWSDHLPRLVSWRVAVSSWLIVGLVAGLLPARTQELRVTMLAVGHGGATLIELPDGRTLLYDAGRLLHREQARRIIQEQLWRSGHSRLDAILLSHADIDHYNAVPELVETLGVQTVCVHRSFLDFRQTAVRQVCADWLRAGARTELIWAGDRLWPDSAVRLEILQPRESQLFDVDNANSVVLEIEYAGRKLLLTGDLDGAGLTALLQQHPPRDLDVLQLPHHGSLAANPPDLPRWGRPEFGLISGGRADLRPRLSEIYTENCRLFNTQEDGAVTCRITATGELHVEPFRSAEKQPDNRMNGLAVGGNGSSL